MNQTSRANRAEQMSDVHTSSNSARTAGPLIDATTMPLDMSERAAIHALPVARFYAALRTCPHGLTQVEAAARLESYGRNVIREIKGTPLVLKFLDNFTNLMAILLWAGGLIAFIAQMPQLGITVWLVNLINGAFGFWQEYKAKKATEALKRLLPHYARVLRDGQEQRCLQFATVYATCSHKGYRRSVGCPACSTPTNFLRCVPSGCSVLTMNLVT